MRCDHVEQMPLVVPQDGPVIGVDVPAAAHSDETIFGHKGAKSALCVSRLDQVVAREQESLRTGGRQTLRGSQYRMR